MTARPFPHRHLLGIEGLKPSEITAILDASEAFFDISRRPIRKAPTLRGKTVINLFYEPSTRTRTSFELAGKRLSADVINISVSTSSAVKGETLLDTVKNLEAMQPDVIVLRHAASGAPHHIAARTRAAVVRDHGVVTTPWPAPTASGPITGTVSVPGSKSVTNQAGSPAGVRVRRTLVSSRRRGA